MEELKKPLEEIRHDPFFRADNFRNEEWYGEFLMFTRIGVCQTLPERALEMQKALKIMGYNTRITEREGKMLILPDIDRNKKSPARDTGAR